MSDFENDIRIDPDALDVEWLEQPKLLYRYSELLSDARYEADLAKEDLDVTKAEVDADIRKNPMKYVGEDKKPTETAITNLICQDKRVRTAERRLAEARREVNLLQAAVSAIEHRKAALQNLVSLLGQEYFAKPREPRNLNGEFSMREQANERRKERVRDKMQKAKKIRRGKK